VAEAWLLHPTLHDLDSLPLQSFNLTSIQHGQRRRKVRQPTLYIPQTKLNASSIPTRRELVREAARQPSTAQLNEAQRELQSHFWTTCPLSHNPLTRPIVSDCVGNLYNKDAILQFLLPGDEGEGSASGISSKADCEAILCGRVKGLRDVVELQFEIDSERREPVSADTNESREGWICPITAKQLGPAVKSVYLVPCGHVFSEEAVRQLKGDRCLQVCCPVPIVCFRVLLDS
jgi:hypothetical protein